MTFTARRSARIGGKDGWIINMANFTSRLFHATGNSEGNGRGWGSRFTARQRRVLAGVVFSLPLIILWGCLLILPIGQTIYYSMTQWNGLTSIWIGPATFIHLFQQPSFLRVLLNNALLLAAVPFAVFIPLAIAFLVNEKIAGWRFFRTVYFLPATLPWVVIGFVSARFFAGSGILNGIFASLGLNFLHQNTLADTHTALIPIAITFIWSQVGPNTLILLTGMATVDQALYDAARIDGAGAWALVRYVTIPLIRRFILFSLTITLIAAFTALFSLIFVMTGGGPGYSTTTLEFFIYERAFHQGQFGFGSTLGVVLLVIMVVISVIQFGILRGED
jgi:multiple sugar transport system permease protein